MKAQYVERGHGRIVTHSFVVHETETPAPQERREETFFADTAFKVPQQPALRIVATT